MPWRRRRLSARMLRSPSPRASLEHEFRGVGASHQRVQLPDKPRLRLKRTLQIMQGVSVARHLIGWPEACRRYQWGKVSNQAGLVQILLHLGDDCLIIGIQVDAVPKARPNERYRRHHQGLVIRARQTELCVEDPHPGADRARRGRHQRAGQPGDLLPPCAQLVRGRARTRHLPARGTRVRRAQSPDRPAPAHARMVRPVASR
jgi:hypothetical protein